MGRSLQVLTTARCQQQYQSCAQLQQLSCCFLDMARRSCTERPTAVCLDAIVLLCPTVDCRALRNFWALHRDLAKCCDCQSENVRWLPCLSRSPSPGIQPCLGKGPRVKFRHLSGEAGTRGHVEKSFGHSVLHGNPTWHL